MDRRVTPPRRVLDVGSQNFKVKRTWEPIKATSRWLSVIPNVGNRDSKIISYQISTSAKCVSRYKWRKRQTTSLNLAPSLTSRSNNRRDFYGFHQFWPVSNHVHLSLSPWEMFILRGHSVLTWFLSEKEGSHVPDGHQLMSHMAPKSCAMPSDKVGFDPELKERRAFQLNCEKGKGLRYLLSTDSASPLLLVIKGSFRIKITTYSWKELK